MINKSLQRKLSSRWNHLLIIIERIMSTCAICLFSKFNASMLTAVNLNVVRWMTEALLFKIKENSVSLLH